MRTYSSYNKENEGYTKGNIIAVKDCFLFIILLRMKTFKIIALLLVLLWGISLCVLGYMFTNTNNQDLKVNDTDKLEKYSVEAQRTVARLLELKYDKQSCKDNLTEYQTIAEYQGVESFCLYNDNEIETLKVKLSLLLEMPYEKVDENIKKAKDNKENEQFEKDVIALSQSESWNKLEGLNKLLGLM